MESKTAEVTPSTQDKSGRRKRRWTVLASALGVVLLGGATGYFWLSSSAEVNAQGVQECTEVVVESPVGDAETDAITDGVCQTLGSLTQAWAAHDAEAYGAAFTESATYTTFAGTYYSGREDIVRSHEALYEGPLEGTELADRFLSLRILSEDAAVMTTRGDTYTGDVPDELTKVQTYTVVSDGDEWKIAAFHNTQRKPVMERVQHLWMPETVPDAEL